MKTKRLHPVNRIRFIVNGEIFRQGWVIVESSFSVTSYKLSKTGETVCYVRGEHRGHRPPLDGDDVNRRGSNIRAIPTTKPEDMNRDILWDFVY